MRRILVSIFGFIVVSFGPPSFGLAGGLAGSSDWPTCLNAPSRACILDEALIRALLVGPAASRELGEIAELQVAMGNLELARRIEQSIPSDQRARVIALAAIVRAQVGSGNAGEAEQTLIQAHRLAGAMQDRLTRAEALLTIGQAEADAGRAAEATRTLSESVKQADGVEIRVGSTCLIMSAPEDRLDGLFRMIAEQLAKAGDIPGSIRVARSIVYKPQIRTEALRGIGEIAARDGRQSEAAAILRDAVEAAGASQSPPQHWPSCPGMKFGPASPDFYVDLLDQIAVTQGRIGVVEDATATLDLALGVVPDIKDSSFWKAEVSRCLVLSAIAATQRKVGLKSQAEVTFQRAAQAASEIGEPRHHVMALTRLARAEYEGGRVPEVTGTFNTALAFARALENPAQRAGELQNLAEAEVGLGLGSEAGPVLSEALGATRSIPDRSGRVHLLSRIARAQANAGQLQDGLSIYAEALDALESTDNPGQRRSLLFTVIRGWPGQQQDARLVADSAPRLLRINDAIDDKQNAAVLILIAKALPQ
jgi:tetratricopeptide (TPR) repeat protein